MTLDRYGELAVYRGFVRHEDEPRQNADVHSGEQAADGQGVELSTGSKVDGIGHGTVITSDGQAPGANVPDDDVSDARWLKALEDEKAKLKELLAEAMFDNAILKDVASRRW